MSKIVQETCENLHKFHSELSQTQEYKFALPSLVQLDALVVQIVQFLQISDDNPLTIELFKSFVRPESLLVFESFCKQQRTPKVKNVTSKPEKPTKQTKHKRPKLSKQSHYITTHTSVWTCRG